MDKRQNTMQLCFCAGKSKMKQALIFKGKPDPRNPRLPASTQLRAEMKKYAKDILVYWDENAYASAAVNQAWMEDFCELAAKNEPEVMLGLDNLSTQKTTNYQQTARDGDVLLTYTPEDTTDLCAVTDDGLGEMTKLGINKLYENDLYNDLDRLINGEVTASERRILMTHWLKQVTDDIEKNKHDTVVKAFQHCGMLNAKDGFENH